MFEEIKMIEQIKEKESRVKIILVFHQQYSQYLHKLNNGDLTNKANIEAFKCHEHIKKLEDMILKECDLFIDNEPIFTRQDIFVLHDLLSLHLGKTTKEPVWEEVQEAYQRVDDFLKANP